MPEAVSPWSLNPINFDETDVIVKAFRDSFGDCMSSVAIEISPEVLCGDLNECASKAVAKEGSSNLTLGLDAFVNAWILRAVNLLCHRSCTRKGMEHKGLHTHGNDWMSSCNVGSTNQTSDGDEEHNEIEDMLGEAQRRIQEAKMEDANQFEYEIEDI